MKNITGKRILMTLTRFDIGGAETHVLELSLELQRMGYHVVVASNGGVYEKNLEEAGVEDFFQKYHHKILHIRQASVPLPKHFLLWHLPVILPYKILKIIHPQESVAFSLLYPRTFSKSLLYHLQALKDCI